MTTPPIKHKSHLYFVFLVWRVENSSQLISATNLNKPHNIRFMLYRKCFQTEFSIQFKKRKGFKDED